MPEVVVTANNSFKQKAKYNPNQKLLSVSSGNIPGLQSDLTLFPESVLQLIRGGFNKSGATVLNIGNEVTSFSSTDIVTTEGFLCTNTDVYYKEALTLAPTAESHWGIYEIELVSEEANAQSLEFYNSGTQQSYTALANTRFKYNIKVYEKYNTTPDFPTATVGRIEWLRYKKTAAFGNVNEVTNLLDVNRIISLLVNNLADASTDKGLAANQGLVLNNKVLDLSKGLASGRLFNKAATPKVITAHKNNVYEVSGNILRLAGDLSLDFNTTTNIYKNDGTTLITLTSETQNKHLYLLMTSAGAFHAMIVPDAEMEGTSHVYANNPELLKDFYAASPVIWDGSKNGYYKNGKRIIGVCRLNGSNEVEFHYALGIGHRFADVQHIPIGGKFTEWRWKREHPACYVPDGVVIGGMATEAPELHRILGSTTLPDWKDRFARNIDLASGRAIRDTQLDAGQGHRHAISDNARRNGDTFAGGGIQAANLVATITILDPITDGVNGIPRIANETRPTNYAELVQIVRG